MKVLVVGAGGVGGYFGGQMSRAGLDVSFSVRQRSLDVIRQRGLSIKSPYGDFTVYPPVTDDPSSCKGVDLIVLAVKCYDIDHVLDQVEPLVRKGSLLLTLQNGVETEEKILKRFPGESLIPGVAYISTRVAEVGVIEHTKRGSVSIGELSGEKSQRLKRIHDLFASSYIPVILSSEIMKTKWEKLCWNATFNPLSVILHGLVGEILASDPAREIVRLGIEEIRAVAAHVGIMLSPTIYEEIISVSEQLAGTSTSMSEDVRNGKPTEIESLNGYIMRRGKEVGVSTPVNTLLWALVTALHPLT